MSHYTTKNSVHLVKGIRGTISELAEYFRVVTPRVARERVTKDGWSVDRAVTEPKRENMSRAKK